MAESEAVSLTSIAKSQLLQPKTFEKQYKNHISGYRDWNQLAHADKYILFPENMGDSLSIDEVSLSNGELFTVLTNKKARGRKGSIIAMIDGTKNSDIFPVLSQINDDLRSEVKEVTLDMANSMDLIISTSFPSSIKVIDRFHVQQIVSNAVQEIRIDLRKKIIKEENDKIKKDRKKGKRFILKIYENGDTKKQLLARSRYLLFKPKSKWTNSQKERSKILFKNYPKLEKAYKLSMMLRAVYENNKNIEDAKKGLDKWYKKIESEGIDSFISAMDTVQVHEETILNYFINRSTNASAESFNAKLKGFRSLVRGIRDKEFHLFRVAKLWG